MSSPTTSLGIVKAEGLDKNIVALELESNTVQHRDSDITITAHTSIAKISLKTEKVDVENVHISPDSKEAPPALEDGPLYGWAVVFVCTLCQMITMGYCIAFGDFQVI
jgi:hypothetical protein